MIKAILFDLDGTLVESKGAVHYETLNTAIETIAGSKYKINEQEHLTIYDGKQTTEKLNLLTELKNLPDVYHGRIWMEKQRLTKELLLKIEKSEKFIEVFKQLKESGLKIACCSNAIRETIEISLDKLGILGYFDFIVSNQDVKSGKPFPEIFWRAMIQFRVLPEECLIVEDAPPGILAAKRSGARVMRVKGPNFYGLEDIQQKINMGKEEKIKWVDEKMNVLILCAGKGSRFADQGYSLPKPLIDVNGEPMLKVVIDSLGVEANYIFVVQKEHREKYGMDSMLNLICPGCKIIEVDGVTEGAACSALLAKEFIDNGHPLLIANADQKVSYNAIDMFYKAQEQQLDGAVLTFSSYSPKWSFVKMNENGFISEVAEKEVISDRATCGVYYWAKGEDFVWSAEKMIAENKRVKGEFYLFPSVAELIGRGAKFIEYPVDEMHGLGTPEDLQHYLSKND